MEYINQHNMSILAQCVTRKNI